MKNNVVVKIIGYIIIICFLIISLNHDSKTNNHFLLMIFLSLPSCMCLSNIIHELGHLLFCKIFKFKINRIVIGFFQYDKANKKLSLNGSCFISGKCAFVIEEGLKTINYFLVFMGGVILNIVTAIIAFILLYSGINSIFNYSVIICCILNVLANGLYSKSTDRKLLKEYIRKNKGD